MRNTPMNNHQSPQGPAITRPIGLLPQNVTQRHRNENFGKKGVAFLSPGCAQNKRACVGWFRPIPTKQEIINIARQNPQAIPYVMLRLNISFNSAEEFENFINGINSNDINFLTMIRDLFYQGINQKKHILPPLQEIDYPFFDIRYSKTAIGNHMLCHPIILGSSDQEISLNPPPITSGNHIILQSFISGVQPPVIKWPQTISIYVNDKLVKPPCIVHYLLIDLTYFGQIKSIRITYQKEPNFYVMILREASYRTFDDIVKELQKLPVSDEFFREGELSLFCPISGEMMQDPGKGKDCKHTQSFDLKNFLQIATFQHRWICPICNKNLEFTDLIYSHESKKKIDMFKSSDGADPGLTDVPFFNDTSGMNDYNDFNEYSDF